MRVKKFVGDNVHDAMRQVKQEMGSNAVILHTRAIKPNGLLRFFQKEQIEITAAVENVTAEEAIRQMPPGAELNKVSNQIYQVQQMVAEMKSEWESSQLLNGIPKNLQKLYHLLISRQIDAQLAKKIVTEMANNKEKFNVEDINACEEVLVGRIEHLIGRVSPIKLTNNKTKIVALIGPTGVGKTTTIAKLAAHFSIIQKKQVAMITADTYRIAAVEQLKIYGDIMGIPVQVVFTQQEMHHSILKFQDKDIVLIDTAGRSHRNQLHMSELKNLLIKDDMTIENILVLSSIVKNEDLYEIVDTYTSDIDYDKIIFTKLDETKSASAIVNIANKTQKTLSYITTGQNVPDDIELINPNRIANSIVRGIVL